MFDRPPAPSCSHDTNFVGSRQQPERTQNNKLLLKQPQSRQHWLSDLAPYCSALISNQSTKLAPKIVLPAHFQSRSAPHRRHPPRAPRLAGSSPDLPEAFRALCVFCEPAGHAKVAISTAPGWPLFPSISRTHINADLSHHESTHGACAGMAASCLQATGLQLYRVDPPAGAWHGFFPRCTCPGTLTPWKHRSHTLQHVEAWSGTIMSSSMECMVYLLLRAVPSSQFQFGHGQC